MAIKSKLVFAGSFTTDTYAYQLIVEYQGKVYYSDRLPRAELQSVKNNITPLNIQRYVERNIISEDAV